MFTLENREYFKCSAEEKKSCLATIDAIGKIAGIVKDQGALALEDAYDEAVGDFLLQTGIKLIMDDVQVDEIKAILETYIVSSYKTGVELLRQVIVLQGILEILDGKESWYKNPQRIKQKLYAFLGEDFVRENKLNEKLYEVETELELAAGSGDTEAMYRLWLTYKDDGNSKAYFKALGWLQDAAAAGHQGAIDEYDAYRADNEDNESEDQSQV
jgi:hypothetical protein